MKNKIYTFEMYKKKVLNTPKKRKDYEDGLIDIMREVNLASAAHKLSVALKRLMKNGWISDRDAIYAKSALKKYEDAVK